MKNFLRVKVISMSSLGFTDSESLKVTRHGGAARRYESGMSDSVSQAAVGRDDVSDKTGDDRCTCISKD